MLYNDVTDFKNKNSCTQEMVVYDKLCGEKIEILDAPEPTDIIWENRSTGPYERFFKMFVVYITILILLLGSSAIIYTCSIFSLAFKNKYPVIECFGPEGRINVEHNNKTINL